jgi:hypothetical protein
VKAFWIEAFLSMAFPFASKNMALLKNHVSMADAFGPCIIQGLEIGFDGDFAGEGGPVEGLHWECCYSL